LKGGETMLKIYEYCGQKYQFEEGEQPAGAVEAKTVTPPEKVAEPEAKAAEPKTKARKPSNKSGKAVTK
jgi:hypothetical protein